MYSLIVNDDALLQVLLFFESLNDYVSLLQINPKVEKYLSIHAFLVDELAIRELLKF